VDRLVAIVLAIPKPFIVLWAAVAIVCLVTAAKSRTNRRRAWSVGICAFAVAMLVTEIVFAVHARLSESPIRVSGSYNLPDYYVRDPDLGYAPRKTHVAETRKQFGSALMYDVKYTSDTAGIRPTPGNPLGRTWVFMGCSYTFGEGLADNQTLPAQFSESMGYHENVVNLAFHGYGAHQMLRRLETNRLPEVHRPVAQVFYQAMFFHVRRSAGRAEWDHYGPKYTLDGDSVVYVGPFHSLAFVLLTSFAQRSDVIAYFAKRLYFNVDFSDRELELYARIVQQAARVSQRNLGASFTIIYWDEDSPLALRVLARLRKTGIPIILVSQIIPRSEWPGAFLPHDHHPNAETDRRIAAFLAARYRD
jgi:hypothetical protein